MVIDKTDQHPNGELIYFSEDIHRYSTDSCQKFHSASAIHHAFFPQFRGDMIAVRIAKKRDCTPEEVKAEWKAKSDEACRIGTLTHNYAEALMVRGKPIPEPTSEREVQLFKYTKNAVGALLKAYDIEAVEKIVFSPSLKICGTLDLLLRNKETKQLHLFDWKTCAKEIVAVNKFKPYECGLRPFRMLKNGNLNHYAIQLNIYKYLLINEGYYKETDMCMSLIHIQEDKWKQLLLPDLQHLLHIVFNNKQLMENYQK